MATINIRIKNPTASSHALFKDFLLSLQHYYSLGFPHGQAGPSKALKHWAPIEYWALRGIEISFEDEKSPLHEQMEKAVEETKKTPDYHCPKCDLLIAPYSSKCPKCGTPWLVGEQRYEVPCLKS